MWEVQMIGMIRRTDTTYYAGYSSGVLCEFTLRVDALPSVVGKVRKAVEGKKAVGIDINDVDKHRAINWNLSAETHDALQTGAVLTREVRQSKPKSKSRPRQRLPRRKQP